MNELIISMQDDLQRKARSAAAAWKARIGASLRRAREARGMSQAALADLIGASVSTVSEIERGVTIPSIGTAWAIADRLGVAIDDLVGRELPAASVSMLPENAFGTGARSAEEPISPEVRECLADLQAQIDALTRVVRAIAPADATRDLKGPRTA